MKKMFICLVLISTTGNLFAQQSTNAEKMFEVPENRLSRRFSFQLEKGEKMQVELTHIADLSLISNIDSMIREFLRDVQPLRDSLGGRLSSRRIDYIIDTSSMKKLRIQVFPPRGSNFLVNNGEAATLKLEQDSIHFLMKFEEKPGTSGKKYIRYCRVSFFLNDLVNISSYMDGQLDEKINTLRANMNNTWLQAGNRQVSLKGNPDITAPAAKGSIHGGTVLSYRLSIDAQNYKNYFVPSFTFGLAISTGANLIKREFVISAENHFTFSKNNSGKLESFRNTFLSLSYGSGGTLSFGANAAFLRPVITAAYLIKQRGDIYEQHTFKIGLGRFSFGGGSTKIEPGFYFNSSFKSMTPTLRVVQYF
jgi:hypothetical protein